MQLLHARDDDSDLLLKKDEEYAQYIAANHSDEFRRQNPPAAQQRSLALQDAYIEQTSAPLTHFASAQPVTTTQSTFEQMYSSLYDTNSEATAISTLTAEEAQWATTRGVRHRQASSLPPLFLYNDMLCGMILKRVTSKKIFKKWNRCVFVVKPSFLQLYRSSVEWRQQGPIYWQTNIHSYMVGRGNGSDPQHASPIMRKSYDNILVYTFELLENPRTNVHINAAIQGVAFSVSLPGSFPFRSLPCSASCGRVWLRVLWNREGAPRSAGGVYPPEGPRVAGGTMKNVHCLKRNTRNRNGPDLRRNAHSFAFSVIRFR